MEIGTKIKKIRELKNLTQDYMAQQLNVSQSTYSRIEKDDGDLTITQLEQISRILEVKVEDLINFNEKFVFNNYTANQANQGYIVNNISPVEKELYEKHIHTLEKEVEYLKQLLDKFSSKF
jgi:transcriptional regulator with XRE-family HTH domain